MKLKEAAITILVDHDYTTIRIIDKEACVTFVEVKLTAEQFCQALGRLSHTPCESAEVFSLDKVNKKMEHKTFEFRISKNTYPTVNEVELARKIAKKSCPEGWEPDNYYNSQGSFFSKGNEVWARTIIRRWVDIKE